MVGADDALGQVILTKNIEGQGYTVEQSPIYQDIISTTLLKTNGLGSSGKITKHIKTIYYMAKDTVDRGDLKIEWCLTEKIWAYVLTKPKQVKSLLLFRSKLMNVPVDYDDEK